MKSANLYSSPSKAWYKENFRRFWVLPLLEFLALFLINILPIILNYSKFENVSDYTETTMSGCNVANIFVFCAVSIVISASVFSYIHGVASSTMIHSMPITRRKLFRASFFSGLIMLIVPVILTSLLFMVVSGAHISPEAVKMHTDSSSYDIITLKAVCIWILESSVMAAFVYAMSNLAGILAGNRLIHVLLAMFINGLPFVLLELVQIYESNFLFGYPDEENLLAFSYVSPVSMAAGKCGQAGYLDIYSYLIYVAVIVAVTLLTSWLYTRIKLERERSACVFPIVSDIVCILLTFICMSLLSLLITSSISETDNGLIQRIPFIVVCIASSVFIYMICRMIADGTTKIFSKVNLKKFGIYVIVVAVFFVFTIFDITGYQQRVPQASKIASVTIESNYAVQSRIHLSSRESVSDVVSLQNAILSEYKNQDFGSASNGESEASDVLSIKYELKNGKTMRRSYTLPDYTGKNGNVKTTKAFKKLYRSTEFSNENLFDTSKTAIKALSEVSLENTYTSNSEVEASEETLISRKDCYGLLKAMNKDLLTMDFNDARTIFINNYDYTSVNLYSNNKDSDESKVSCFYLNKFTKNTIRYLKATGYLDQQ